VIIDILERYDGGESTVYGRGEEIGDHVEDGKSNIKVPEEDKENAGRRLELMPSSRAASKEMVDPEGKPISPESSPVNLQPAAEPFDEVKEESNQDPKYIRWSSILKAAKALFTTTPIDDNSEAVEEVCSIRQKSQSMILVSELEFRLEVAEVRFAAAVDLWYDVRKDLAMWFNDRR